MKIRETLLTLLILAVALNGAYAQSLQVSPELKDLLQLSVNKDYKIASTQIDKQIALSQQKAVRSVYLPKLEIGGKYMYALSSINSKTDEITGFEDISKLKDFMKNPAFPVMFPTLAKVSSEVNQLQQLLVKQGVHLPTFSNNVDGKLHGNYFSADATLSAVLFTGGQVENSARALNEKIKVQEALSDKGETDVLSDVITAYDQLALLDQSRQVLDESAIRLTAEKKLASTALKNGMATSFDTLKIAVAEANLNAKISEYENRRTLLHQKLAQLTGKPANAFDNMHPALEIMLLSQGNVNIDNRAEMRALEAGVEARKYLLKAEKSHYLPKVQAMVQGRYDYFLNPNTDLTAPFATHIKMDYIGIGPSLMAGVGFKWELFDRSGGTAKEQQAALELKKAQNARDEARELLDLNLTKTRASYNTAISQVEYKQKQLNAARMALNLAQKSYNAGTISITERLAAETEMQSSQLEYLQAIFNQRQATLECYKATGNLRLSNIK